VISALRVKLFFDGQPTTGTTACQPCSSMAEGRPPARMPNENASPPSRSPWGRPRYHHTGIGTLTFDVNVGSSSSSSLSKQGSAVVSAVTAGTKPAIAEVRALAAARVRLLRALALTPMVIVRVV
jgi:hypothetical protein